MSDAPPPATLKIESWPLLGLPKGFLDPKWPTRSGLVLQPEFKLLFPLAARGPLIGAPVNAPFPWTLPHVSAGSLPIPTGAPKDAPVSKALPVHKFVLGGPTSSTFAPGVMLESFRSVCSLIAEHCGRPGKILNGVIWLSIDSKRFYDGLDDPQVSKSKRVVQTTELLSGALSVIAAATGAEGWEKASTGVHFVAQFGDNYHKGTLTLKQSDLAQLNPQPDSATAVEILKLGEIFIPAE